MFVGTPFVRRILANFILARERRSQHDSWHGADPAQSCRCFSSTFVRLSSRGGSQPILHRAHWAITALSWGPRKQDGRSACSLLYVRKNRVL